MYLALCVRNKSEIIILKLHTTRDYHKTFMMALGSLSVSKAEEKSQLIFRHIHITFWT